MEVYPPSSWRPSREPCPPGCTCQRCEETRRETERSKTRFLIELIATLPPMPSREVT